MGSHCNCGVLSCCETFCGMTLDRSPADDLTSGVLVARLLLDKQGDTYDLSTSAGSGAGCSSCGPFVSLCPSWRLTRALVVGSFVLPGSSPDPKLVWETSFGMQGRQSQSPKHFEAASVPTEGKLSLEAISLAQSQTSEQTLRLHQQFLPSSQHPA